MRPTVVPNSSARRFSSSWVSLSIRTLVVCMQISIHPKAYPAVASLPAIGDTLACPSGDATVRDYGRAQWKLVAWACHLL